MNQAMQLMDAMVSTIGQGGKLPLSRPEMPLLATALGDDRYSQMLGDNAKLAEKVGDLIRGMDSGDAMLEWGAKDTRKWMWLPDSARQQSDRFNEFVRVDLAEATATHDRASVRAAIPAPILIYTSWLILSFSRGISDRLAGVARDVCMRLCRRADFAHETDRIVARLPIGDIALDDEAIAMANDLVDFDYSPVDTGALEDGWGDDRADRACVWAMIVAMANAFHLLPRSRIRFARPNW